MYVTILSSQLYERFNTWKTRAFAEGLVGTGSIFRFLFYHLERGPAVGLVLGFRAARAQATHGGLRFAVSDG